VDVRCWIRVSMVPLKRVAMDYIELRVEYYFMEYYFVELDIICYINMLGTINC